MATLRRPSSGYNLAMPLEHAQLVSVAAALEELTARVTGVADRYAGTPEEHLATDLYEVERALRTAGRGLAKVVRQLED